MADLCILAEKPKAGKKFSTYLGGKPKLPSLVSYHGKTCLITASHGHLMEFVDPTKMLKDESLVGKYKSWNPRAMPWNPQDLTWKKHPIPGDAKDVRRINHDASKCQGIVIATDNDPSGEGDLLGWEIIQAIKWRNPVYRIRFPAVTKGSFLKAMAGMSNMKLRKNWGKELKAEGRSRWDYLSMQETRIATTAVRQAGFRVRVVNEGRLKSVMLYKIYQRLLAIKNYVKTPYFEVRYKDDNGHVYLRRASYSSHPKFRLKSHNLAEEAMSSYGVDVPSGVKVQTKRQAPGPFLNLASLDAKLSSKGFSSKNIQNTYQKMYEDNLVSYPRTDDKKITKEQFYDLLPYANRIADVVGVDKSLLTHRTPRKKHLTKHADHGANRPGTTVPKSLESLRRYGTSGPAIYKTLAKNYLATLCEDYVYKRVTAHLAQHPKFVTSFNVPVKQNYRQVFNNSRYKKNDAKPLGKQAKPFIYQGSNPKPAYPTKTWLYNYLDKVNVGTGATRLGTMTVLTSGKYKKINVKRSRLMLNRDGIICAYMASNTYIGNANITKQLYEVMDAVEVGKRTVDDVVNTATITIKHDKPIFMNNAKHLKEVVNMDSNDNNKPERVPIKYDGRDTSFNRNFFGHRFTDDEVKALKAGKEIKFKASARGKRYIVKGKLAQQTYKHHAFLGVKLSSMVCLTAIGHQLTDDEVRALKAGKTITIDAKSKKGNQFKAKGKLVHKKFSDGVLYYRFNMTDWGDDPKRDKKIKAWRAKKRKRPIAEVDGKKGHFRPYAYNNKLTPTEIKNLQAGKTITKNMKAKSGNTYKAKVNLKWSKFRGHTFLGVNVKPEWND